MAETSASASSATSYDGREILDVPAHIRNHPLSRVVVPVRPAVPGHDHPRLEAFHDVDRLEPVLPFLPGVDNPSIAWISL